MSFEYCARVIWLNHGSPGNFRTWFFALAARYGFVEGKDFLQKDVESLGRPRKEVFLTTAAFRTIRMGYGREKNVLQPEIAKRTLDAEALLSNPRALAKLFLDYADKKERYELVCASNLTLTAQEIAKDLGLESAVRLNKLLIELGYLFRSQSGKTLPRANKVPKECYQIKSVEANGRVVNQLVWTSEGKVWISGVLGGKNEGIRTK